MRKSGWLILSLSLTVWLLLAAAIFRPAEAGTLTLIPRAYFPLVARSLAPTPTPLPDFEQQVIDLINRERAARGLAPLHVDDRLMWAARRHSQDMADNNCTGHTGCDGSSPLDRMLREGYVPAAWGETLAAGYPGPASVVAAWMMSSPHRAILLGDYRDIGVGYAFNADGHYGHYWTVDVAVPAASAEPE